MTWSLNTDKTVQFTTDGRLAIDNFGAFAPDALFPLGGYPGDEDKAREVFPKLDQAKTREDFIAAANRGGYEYLVLTMDREGQKLDQPRELTWIAPDPAVEPVILADGGAVLRLDGPLSPETCLPKNRLKIEKYHQFETRSKPDSAKTAN